jgi:hypothetical protein
MLIDYSALIVKAPPWAPPLVALFFFVLNVSFGAGFLLKGLRVLRLLNVVADNPTVPGDKQAGKRTGTIEQSARGQVLRMSKLGVLSGVIMLWTCALLLWFGLSPGMSSDADSSLFFFFNATWVLRYLITYTQVEMCRLPPRIRNKHATRLNENRFWKAFEKVKSRERVA